MTPEQIAPLVLIVLSWLLGAAFAWVWRRFGGRVALAAGLLVALVVWLAVLLAGGPS